MLEINGSYGEGGGQVLRNAVALSTLTKTPINIKNIRANRPNPGLKAQHYIAIKSIAEICNAKIEGLKIGSSEIIFKPGIPKGGHYKFEIGTAGSITLVFQAIILSCLKTKEKISVSLSGGTDVKWSPSWDYFENVYLKLLENMGVDIISKLILRGYYPKGGGEGFITIKPVSKIKPLKLGKKQIFESVKGNISISNLPDHIVTRMKHMIIKTLLKNDLLTTITSQKTSSLSPGVSVTLWSGADKEVIGSYVLGEKGVPSEDVGRSVASNLLKEIKSDVTVDVYGFDQILPFMVLAKQNGESSCLVRILSSHASTNMWLLQQFFDVSFDAMQSEKNISISVK